MALRPQQVMMADSARTGNIQIHFSAGNLGKHPYCSVECYERRPSSKDKKGCYANMTHPVLSLHENSSTTQQPGEKLLELFFVPSQLFLPFGTLTSQFSSHNSLCGNMVNRNLINVKNPAVKKKKKKKLKCTVYI